MYNLTQLHSFAEAVKGGSLSAAARALGLTQPAVSQHIHALEKRARQTLLVRLRGGVQTTDAGDIMYHHAQRVLLEIAQMEDQLNALSGVISGAFKFTASEVMSQTVAAELFTRLRQRAPELTVNLIPSDKVLDVEAEQIDLALRIGHPGHGGGIVRRIGDSAGVLVAAPDYLDRLGRPEDLSELIKLDYVQYREAPDQSEMSLIDADGRSVTAQVKPAFAAHSPSLMLHALKQGLGFAQVPLFAAGQMIDEGSLVRVLSQYHCPPKAIYIVQAQSKLNTLANRLACSTLLEVLTAQQGITLTETARQGEKL